MTPLEQAAFVKAYANNVADVPEELVAEFVRKWDAGIDMDYSSEYTSIMDSLMMWLSAINWKISQF